MAYNPTLQACWLQSPSAQWTNAHGDYALSARLDRTESNSAARWRFGQSPRGVQSPDVFRRREFVRGG
jgi:hypothetical protein